jgi:hypothetical protein
MKNENSRQEQHNEKEGIPIPALLLVIVLGFTVIAIIVKMAGMM